MPSPAIASQADLLGTIPVVFLMKSGELRLADDRLVFTDDAGARTLDAPVGELHSVARSVMGIQVWHGEQRYRFAFSRANRGTPPEDVRTMAEAWVTLLEPVVAPAPSGTAVRAPWPMWAWGLAIGGILLGVLVIAGFLIQLQG